MFETKNILLYLARFRHFYVGDKRSELFWDKSPNGVEIKIRIAWDESSNCLTVRYVYFYFGDERPELIEIKV